MSDNSLLFSLENGVQFGNNVVEIRRVASRTAQPQSWDLSLVVVVSRAASSLDCLKNIVGLQITTVPLHSFVDADIVGAIRECMLVSIKAGRLRVPSWCAFSILYELF